MALLQNGSRDRSFGLRNRTKDIIIPRFMPLFGGVLDVRFGKCGGNRPLCYASFYSLFFLSASGCDIFNSQSHFYRVTQSGIIQQKRFPRYQTDRTPRTNKDISLLFSNRFNLMLAWILQSHFFVKKMCEKETSRNSSIHVEYDDYKFGINVSKNKVFPLPYVLKINVPSLIIMLVSRSLPPFFTIFHLHNNDPPIACSHNWAPHTCFTLLHVMVFCSFT